MKELKEKIKKIEVLRESLEKYKTDCYDQLLKSDEASKKLYEIIKMIGSVFEPDSKAFRIFDRLKKERTLWWKETISGYVEKTDCGHFDYWIEAIDALIEEIDPVFSKEKKNLEYYFKNDEKYAAQKCLAKLFRKADDSLYIIDSYLDDEVFDYIESIEELIEIKLITANKKPLFKKLYQSFKEKRGNVEAREYKDCHDRFVIIDNKEAWQLGTSINGFGKKAFRISKIGSNVQLEQIMEEFEHFWKSGKIL